MDGQTRRDVLKVAGAAGAKTRAPPTTRSATCRRDFDEARDPGHNASMSTVSKNMLNGNMLEYLRQVEETGEELIVTDDGRPVVKVVPIRKRRTAADVFGDVRGRVVYRGDILAPTTDEWPES
jgi:prevent-host-death family protein